MIEIIIKTDGVEIMDSLNDSDCTLTEVGVALLRLKQIEQKLIDKEFSNKIEITKPYGEEGEEDEDEED